MRVCAGPLLDIPEDRCQALPGGAAVVVRSGRRVHAYANQCLHQDSPLSGGWVCDGLLVCPQHFWRYHLDDGHRIGGPGGLTSFPVEIDRDLVWVDLPDRRPTLPLREQLLLRARSYDRAEAYASWKPTDSSQPPEGVQ